MAKRVDGWRAASNSTAFSTQLGQTTLGAGPRNNACNQITSRLSTSGFHPFAAVKCYMAPVALFTGKILF